jgi:hypothetical protein
LFDGVPGIHVAIPQAKAAFRVCVDINAVAVLIIAAPFAVGLTTPIRWC